MVCGTEEEEEVAVVVVGARLKRRVSWMPGAEGAPLERDDEVVCKFVVDVAWPDAGTIRRA